MANNLKGKFRERLNNIRLNRIRMRKGINNNTVDIKSENTNKNAFLNNNVSIENIDINNKKNNLFGNNSSIDNVIKNKEDLGVKILKKIEKKLEKQKNELEIINSELEVLKIYNKDESLLEESKKQLKKIKELEEKLEKMKKQYEILKFDYGLEGILDIEETDLMEDLLEFKRLFNYTDKSQELIKNSNIIDDYIYLFTEINKISDKEEELKNLQEKKVADLEQRDEKYELLKTNIINIKEVEESIDDNIRKQKNYFNELISKINVIDRHEKIKYIYEGFGEMIAESIRYIGLMMVSPLSGIIPGIAASTLVTRKIIRNLSENLAIKEIKKTYYSTIDYEEEINYKLNDINDVKLLINKTSEEVERFIKDFKSKFEPYKYQISEYEKTYRKIEQIQKNITNNKKKIEIIEENLQKSKKVNEAKKEKVKKMNEQIK